MMSLRTFQHKLSAIFRHWEDEHYDVALRELDELLTAWPGNPQLLILWASLVQLQEETSYTLDAAKQALQRAHDLDRNSPTGTIELGHFLDDVEDDPRAASKAFAEGILSARRLLIDGLLGQARALLQLGKREEALQCLMEALYLASRDHAAEKGKAANAAPDILLRDPAGGVLAFQVKGPFAAKVEDLLQELFPKRSA
jgi:tetratricopeptide (TPR) repeat protein